MELACPSCSSKHKTEDYPGAFEIQCSCGYSILVPDEAALAAESDSEVDNSNGPPPSFDDPPMAMDELQDSQFALAGDESSENQEQVEGVESFSSLNLSDPKDLPDDMPYDPFELQDQWAQSNPEDGLAPKASATFTQGVASTEGVSDKGARKEGRAKDANSPAIASTSTKTEGQDIVNRIQMASIGYLQGSLFDLEIEGLSKDLVKDLALHTQKFLSTRTYLREGLSKDFENPELIFKQPRILAVPEILAVEIYLYCTQNQISCKFSTHKEA